MFEVAVSIPCSKAEVWGIGSPCPNVTASAPRPPGSSGVLQMRARAGWEVEGDDGEPDGAGKRMGYEKVKRRELLHFPSTRKCACSYFSDYYDMTKRPTPRRTNAANPCRNTRAPQNHQHRVRTETSVPLPTHPRVLKIRWRTVGVGGPGDRSSNRIPAIPPLPPNHAAHTPHTTAATNRVMRLIGLGGGARDLDNSDILPL